MIEFFDNGGPELSELSADLSSYEGNEEEKRGEGQEEEKEKE